ncbi:MAG: hypothetical protein LBK95_11600, partial [Bifidobacteriaceae bacterium]|nr:hypothetical protein [Bifidobacteriaceae bacterium]
MPDLLTPFTQLMLQMINWGADCIEAAFSADLSTVSVAEWGVATSLNGKLAYVMTVVAVALAAVEITAGALRQNMAQVGRAVVLVVLAWPVTLMVTWVTVHAVAATDQLTGAMVNGAGLKIRDGLIMPMISGFGLTEDPDTQAIVATGTFGLGGGVTLAAVLWLIGTVLTVIMAFRAFGIVVLVAALPLAFMVQSGGQAVREMRVRWIQMAVALALTKPLAALVVLVASGMLGVSSGGDGFADSIATYCVGVVGLVIACAAPKLCGQFVAFAGGVVAAAGGGSGVSERVAGAGRTGVRAALGRTPLGQRLGLGAGSLPAGRGPTGRPGAGTRAPSPGGRPAAPGPALDSAKGGPGAGVPGPDGRAGKGAGAVGPEQAQGAPGGGGGSGPGRVRDGADCGAGPDGGHGSGGGTGQPHDAATGVPGGGWSPPTG